MRPCGSISATEAIEPTVIPKGVDAMRRHTAVFAFLGTLVAIGLIVGAFAFGNSLRAQEAIGGNGDTTSALGTGDNGSTTTDGIKVLTGTGNGTDGIRLLTANDNTSGACHLDKIGTWSEANSVDNYRIEVGGGGTQHVDFYPARGTKAVSFIVGPTHPAMIWMGFGSIWEGNGPECAKFDYVADATSYAQGRLDSGHSGLVFDLRFGKVTLVGNQANLSDSEIANLMSNFAAAMFEADGTTPLELNGYGVSSGNATGGNGNNGGEAKATPTQKAGAAPTNCKATPTTHDPVNGEYWTIEGDGPMIVNFWTNWAGYDQAEHKLLLDPGTYKLGGGGTLYTYPKGCETQVKQEFKGNSLPEVTLDQLKSDGLTG